MKAAPLHIKSWVPGGKKEESLAWGEGDDERVNKEKSSCGSTGGGAEMLGLGRQRGRSKWRRRL